VTTAQRQALRFVKTPCLASPSRRKLKSLMWRRKDLDGETAAKMCDKHEEWKARLEAKQSRIAVSHGNNFEVFMEALTSLGGEFHAVKDDSEKKVHASDEVREPRPVEEITSHLAGVRAINQLEKKLLTLAEDTDEWRDNLKQQGRLNKSYYRDVHGSLVRFVR
jgi:hypothetical protein